MAESSVGVAPPQRPPPPNRTISPPSLTEEAIRVVDSRSSKPKHKTTAHPKQVQPGSGRTISPETGFTIIDSKHSPLLEQKSPAKASAPPPRPQPPVARPTHSPPITTSEVEGSNESDTQASVKTEGGLIQLSPSLTPSDDQPPQPKPRPFSPPRQADHTYSTVQDVSKPKPTDSPAPDSPDYSDHLYAVVNKPNKKQQPNSPTVTPVVFDDPVYSGAVEPPRLSPPAISSNDGIFDDPMYGAHKEAPKPPKRPETPPNNTVRLRSRTMDSQSSSGSEGHKRSSFPRAPPARAQGTVSPSEGTGSTGPEQTTSDTADRSRPSRPPPPSRSLSVPKSKSLTTYKEQRGMRERSPTMDVGSLQRNPPKATPPRAPPPTPTKRPSPSTGLLVDLSDTSNGKDCHTSGSQSPVQPPAGVKDPNHPLGNSPISSPELTPTHHDQSPPQPLPPPDTDNIMITEANGPTPVIPPRPPQRPFPPRPNSGRQGSSRPPKLRDHSVRSPHHPSNKSPKKPRSVAHAHTHHSLSVSQSPADGAVDVTQSLPPGGRAAVMTASEGPIEEVEPVDESRESGTPTLSITARDGVKFGFPDEAKDSPPPDYQSSLPATLRLSPEPTGQQGQEEKEATDKVSELQQPRSPKLGSGKLLNSMKKRFSSLRKPRKTHSDGELSIQRTQSDQTVGAISGSKRYPDPLPEGVINPLVVKCVAYLNRESVLVEQGLFRIPGDVASIRKLRTAFISGQNVDLNDVLDPHTVCGLLKLHFREMRVSLIPRGPTLTELISHVKQKDVEAVRRIINGINITHIATLTLVIEVFTKVVAHSDVNRMTAGTLATSCGPSIFPYLPPSNSNQLLKFLVDHCTEIFSS